MQTHSFIADTAQAAVEQIRNELGPNAIVLSVRKLPRGGISRLMKKEQIEVVAGVEQAHLDVVDESPDPVKHLQDEVQTLKHQFAALRLAHSVPAATRHSPAPASPPSSAAQLLNDSGLLPGFSERLVNELPAAQRQANPPSPQLLRNLLRSKWRSDPPLLEAAVHIFVGVPGSGKSTVLCKMLAQTALVDRQPATVYQLDSHVANSAGQTGIFAEIIGAHFERTLPERFERREESVFVDLPGVPLGDDRGLAALRAIIASFGVPQVHLVLNGAYESAHLLNQAAFFSSVGISSLIVSHLDEEIRWGKLWNLILGTNYSLRYLSCGQNVPGDLLIPTAEQVLDRQFREK